MHDSARASAAEGESEFFAHIFSEQTIIFNMTEIYKSRASAGDKKFSPGRAAAAILLALFCAAFFYDPERYAARCFEGIALWAQCVLPSLFPLMVVCALMTSGGLAGRAPKFLERACMAVKLPPCAAACFMLGTASGYPAGSRTVRQFADAHLVDDHGARKLALLCTACGPVFVIATAGNMFAGNASGIKLYIAHIVAVATTALAYSLCTKPCSGRLPELKGAENVLEAGFYGAVQSALTAGAFIAFFHTAAAMADDFYILFPIRALLSLPFGGETAAAFSRGLVEMTGGIAALAGCGGKFALPLAGFTLTFGGACVLAQQLSFLSGAGVRPAFFISFKFLQAALCFAILLLFG